MRKLKLDSIVKTYTNGEKVVALQGVSLDFRENEFVAILGPSGCGKTTLLNIIGGLDRYDSGDLCINGISTKKYRAADWDAYRNRSIGFVFQNYNLIGHQTVLQNVEIALTLSGVSAKERKRRAKQALEDVGLADQSRKKPNQLSGGQMQRVAIARALINNPDILLADEPTGALDSHTSVQVMDILKEIAKTRLVIMVTHNGELAEEYATRIIRLLDGEVQSDSNQPEKETVAELPGAKGEKRRKTSMSLRTATMLSLKNLLTKKGRTLTTSLAGSIGIIGVALVLALNSGLSAYMGDMQTDMLSGFPITIDTNEQSVDRTVRIGMTEIGDSTANYTEFPDDATIRRFDSDENTTVHKNIFNENYLQYIGAIKTALPNTVNTISYRRGVSMNILAKAEDTVVKFERTGGRGGSDDMIMLMGEGNYFQEMPDNNEFVLSLYDLIGTGSRLPETRNEVVLVVDSYNRLNERFFEMMGIAQADSYSVADFIGKTMLKVVDNDSFYQKKGELFTAAGAADYATLFADENGTLLTIVGVLRIKEEAASEYFSQGFVYTHLLTDYFVENAKNSQIALAQAESEQDVLTGIPFAKESAKEEMLLSLGANTTPVGINIYPVDFDAKEKIKNYLDAYNDGKTEADQVLYSDMAETISEVTGTLLDTVSLVLVGFAAISLLVSTIMIGIITYVSVIERTKEIGILRSVGARKKDISRVFNAETLIIGCTAGSIGICLAYLATIPINTVIATLVEIENIAVLNPLHALLLVAGSMVLTLIAGFFPSRMAANKDPVEALRAE